MQRYLSKIFFYYSLRISIVIVVFYRKKEHAFFHLDTVKVFGPRL